MFIFAVWKTCRAGDCRACHPCIPSQGFALQSTRRTQTAGIGTLKVEQPDALALPLSNVSFFSPAWLVFNKQAGVCIAGGNDRPRAAEFRELSLAPWAYMCQAINLWQNIAGVAACAYVSHLVWPLRGPVALGGNINRRLPDVSRFRYLIAVLWCSMVLRAQCFGFIGANGRYSRCGSERRAYAPHILPALLILLR